MPEPEVPVTIGGIPKEDKSAKPEDDGELENAGGETMKRMSPMHATIIGALDGLKMAASIAAILIFGPKRIPELGSTLGKTLRGFKEEINSDRDDDTNSEQDKEL